MDKFIWNKKTSNLLETFYFARIFNSTMTDNILINGTFVGWRLFVKETEKHKYHLNCVELLMHEEFDTFEDVESFIDKINFKKYINEKKLRKENNMAIKSILGIEGPSCDKGESGIGTSYIAFKCPLCGVVGKKCGELEIWWGTPAKATITICGVCYERIKYKKGGK